MSSYQLRDRAPDESLGAGPTGVAPGKRTLTDRLPAGPESLRGRERDVRSFDPVGEYYDTRETIERPERPQLLDDKQLARARRKNPGWVQRMKLDSRRVSGAAPESDIYAQEVAAQQAKAGITVDGISGPKTVEALFQFQWEPPKKRGRGRGRGRESGEELAMNEHHDAGGHHFDGEDPFAMHLLEDDGADADPSVLAGIGGGS